MAADPQKVQTLCLQGLAWPIAMVLADPNQQVVAVTNVVNNAAFTSTNAPALTAPATFSASYTVAEENALRTDVGALWTQFNALRADCLALQTTVNNLLAQLR